MDRAAGGGVQRQHEQKQNQYFHVWPYTDNSSEETAVSSGMDLHEADGQYGTSQRNLRFRKKRSEAEIPFRKL